jgi:hypothetical protein
VTQGLLGESLARRRVVHASDLLFPMRDRSGCNPVQMPEVDRCQRCCPNALRRRSIARSRLCATCRCAIGGLELLPMAANAHCVAERWASVILLRWRLAALSALPSQYQRSSSLTAPEAAGRFHCH